MATKRISVVTVLLTGTLLSGCATLTPEGERVTVIEDKGMLSEGCRNLGPISTLGSEESREESLKYATNKARNAVGKLGGSHFLAQEQKRVMFTDIKLSGEAYRCGQGPKGEVKTITNETCIELGGDIEGNFCRIPLQ